MSLYTRIFFFPYAFLWKVALLFLRKKKRIRDGYAQRLVPLDWLEQNLQSIQNRIYDTNPDKPFFGEKPKEKDNSPYNVDLWIQAASGGEAFLAIECLKAIPKKSRQINILVTTWTRQGMQVLEQECEKLMQTWQKEDERSTNTTKLPYIQIRFTPLDTEDIVERAFDLASPRVFMLLETELWPQLMKSCKEREIPLYIANGRMTRASFELYKMISPVLNAFAPKQIFAMTQEEVDRFAHIFPSSLVSFIPNMKFDRALDLVQKFQKKQELRVKKNIPTNLVEVGQDTVSKSTVSQFEELNNSEYKKNTCIEKQVEKENKFQDKSYLNALPLLFSKADKSFLFASVRQKEENILSALLWKLYPARPNDIFIVAPRHLHRVELWKSRFYDLGMNFMVASEFLEKRDWSTDLIKEDNIFPPQTCIIWDIFGDLSELYFHTDVSFVGGSFKKCGGQNFLEALACGAVTHVGPDLDNFLWALGEERKPSLVDVKLLFKHESPKSLKNAFINMPPCKKSEEERQAIQDTFETWLQERSGGKFLTMNKIFEDSQFQVSE